jgi:hypothetical protein
MEGEDAKRKEPLNLETRKKPNSLLHRTLSQFGPARLRKMEQPPLQEGFYLPDIIAMEERAIDRQRIEDATALWEVPYYGQRKYWLKLFIGFHYAFFAPLFTHWILASLPEPSFSEDTMRMYEYLANNAGIEQKDAIFGLKVINTVRKVFGSKSTSNKTDNVGHSTSSLATADDSAPSNASTSSSTLTAIRSGGIGPTRTLDEQAAKKLTRHRRQSKLSQEQLSELQRSTHFDKKELQQWYKGESDLKILSCSTLIPLEVS